MKVLHSYKVYRPDVDGGIPFVIATLTGPHAAGLDNRILVARKKGMSKNYRVEGIPVDAVGSLGTVFSTPLAPTFPFALIDHAKSSDIVVHHAPFPLADLAISWFPNSAALIVYWHADIIGFRLLKTLVMPAILNSLRRADRIVVADQSTIAGSPVLHAFADKCMVIPYGIDTHRWSACSEQEQAASRLLRQQHPRMILAIGRLVPYKGFDVLLRALKEVDGHAILIGEGPLDVELRSMAETLGVADRVTFAGRLSDSAMKAHLHAARVLAFPSVTTAEAFGIVQLEAMAAGLPIVNTLLASAVPQIARHELEGLTVPPHDAPALAAALRRILDDPTLADRLGRAGQVRARTEYSEETYVSRIRCVYDDVLRTRGGIAGLGLRKG